jgi:hypothetical protein
MMSIELCRNRVDRWKPKSMERTPPPYRPRATLCTTYPKLTGLGLCPSFRGEILGTDLDCQGTSPFLVLRMFLISATPDNIRSSEHRSWNLPPSYTYSSVATVTKLRTGWLKSLRSIPRRGKRFVTSPNQDRPWDSPRLLFDTPLIFRYPGQISL